MAAANLSKSNNKPRCLPISGISFPFLFPHPTTPVSFYRVLTPTRYLCLLPLSVSYENEFATEIDVALVVDDVALENHII
jgi:hypothetical protein